MGDEIYLKFEVLDKFIYSFIGFLFILGFLGVVFAYQTGLPPSYAGHSGNEISVNILGVEKTLQKAIDDYSNLPVAGSNLIYGSPGYPLTNPMPAPYLYYADYWYGYRVGPGKNCVTMANKGGGPCATYDSYCRYSSATGLVDTFKTNNGCGINACSYVCY